MGVQRARPSLQSQEPAQHKEGWRRSRVNVASQVLFMRNDSLKAQTGDERGTRRFTLRLLQTPDVQRNQKKREGEVCVRTWCGL